MIRFRCIVAAVFGFAIALAHNAQANGRFPAADQLVVSPSNPNLLVLRSTYGLLFSKDRGVNWDWTCEKSIGYGGSEDPSMGLTAGGGVIAGTFEGVSVSQDLGCNWKFAEGSLTRKIVIDVVVRPDTPQSALILTNNYSSADDAGALFDTNVFATTDDGKSFSVLGPALDPRLIVETIEVAASDPERIYVSAVRNSGTANVAGLLLTSTNRGMSWTERPIPLAMGENAPFIAAVDPKNALRLYVRTAGKKPSANRLLVTDDGGMTFRSVFAGMGDMLGFALVPDGSKVFVGGPTDGLHVASTKDFVFTKKSSVKVQCLAWSASTLFACSNEASGFILGASTDEGATFDPLLHLAGLRGPLECPATSTQAQCVPQWPGVRDQLGGSAADAGSVTDAGPADAGAEGPAVDKLSAGGGCREGGMASTALLGGAGAPALIVVAALALARRRRSARSR